MPEDPSGQPVRTGDFPDLGTLAGHGRGWSTARVWLHQQISRAALP